MRILLAMSGGVDSSTVAHMLVSQGHDVVGVRFGLWSDPLAPAMAQLLPSKCCTTQNISRASRVCKDLGIPLHVIDLSDMFKEKIVDPFLESYKKGSTPNPCIVCNRTIKFGKLIELLETYDCEKLATGHYARIASEEVSDGTVRHLLLEAIDKQKDQSYYLYGLQQEQLAKTMFPLGGMRKEDVYALATSFNIPMSDSYRESQDLCFFPEKTPQDFLRRHLQSSITPGKIVRRDGTVVGAHDGIALYTIGQRRGLKIGGLKVPLEVVAKNPATNELVVATKGTETIKTVTIKEMHWVSWQPQEKSHEFFSARTRSLGMKTDGVLIQEGSTAVFSFSSPQSPQAPGQSLVLYRGEEVVGGGVIENTST